MSIRVLAKHNVKPEKLDEFIRLSKQLVEDTRKNDWGCIQYQFCQDINTPTTTAMFEEWENDAAMSDHLKAKHFTDVLEAMRACLVGPTEVGLFKPL